MITRLADGFTLQYTDANGQQVQIGPFDPNYFNVLNVLTMQQDAQRQNNQAYNGYMLTLHNMQAALDAQQPMGAAPAKPLMIQVDDQGNTSHVPWTPPLPDAPAAPTVLASSGSIRANAPAPDRLDVLMNIATAQAAMIKQMQADVAAIRARVGA